MKKQATKKDDAPEERALTIGDMVLTSISLRAGEIIRIEEKKGEYRSYSGCEEYREYTVRIPMPMLDQALFKNVLMICKDSELRRAR